MKDAAIRLPPIYAPRPEPKPRQIQNRETNPELLKNRNNTSALSELSRFFVIL